MKKQKNKLIRRAIYPGSFDPFTNGHLDIVDRALSIFHELTIVVAQSSRKSTLLSVPERVRLIQEVFQENPRVKVDHWSGLIMDYAKKHSIHAVIRGLRAASDFEYEFMMAAMNKDLNPNVETFFMMTGRNLFFISSTMIKELFLYGGDIRRYVPRPVFMRLMKQRRKGNL